MLDDLHAYVARRVREWLAWWRLCLRRGRDRPPFDAERHARFLQDSEDLVRRLDDEGRML